MRVLHKILVTLSTGLFLNVNAQEVLVSHPDYPSSHLKMIGDNQGFHLPNVSLENVTLPNPLPSVVDGMMVYNTNPNIINGNGKGVYTSIDNKWIFAGENYNYQIIKDYNFLPELGYEVGYAINAVSEFTSSGIKFIKKGCNIDANTPKSEYCIYEANQVLGVTWEEAFYAAKQINGHLATITSRTEQDAVNNMIGNDLPAWLGLRKVYKKDSNGQNSIIIPHLYNITGEEFEVEWSNQPKQFNNFSTPRTNSANANCVVMDTDGSWVEKECEAKALNTQIKSILVEFKKAD